MRNCTNGSPARLSGTFMLFSLWIPHRKAWRTGLQHPLPSSTGTDGHWAKDELVVSPESMESKIWIIAFLSELKACICIRCVLNWFGDWSTEALYQVGKEFTSKMDLEKPNYKVPDYMPIVYDKLPQPPSHREAIVNGCVFVHQTLHQVWCLTTSKVLVNEANALISLSEMWL